MSSPAYTKYTSPQLSKHRVSPAKAARVVSSLRLAAIALRQEREKLAIDSPLAVADLCSESVFGDWMRNDACLCTAGLGSEARNGTTKALDF